MSRPGSPTSQSRSICHTKRCTHNNAQKAWRWHRAWTKHLQKLVVEADARGYTPGC